MIKVAIPKDMAPVNQIIDNEIQGKGWTLKRVTKKVGRNAPCPCKSGKKFKNCCGS